jgi:hypothetical protein
MAGTISFSFSLVVNNGVVNDVWNVRPDLITQAVAGVFGHCQDIPTTSGGTVIVLTGITANGVAWFQNLDTTHTVIIGPDSGGSIVNAIELLPGEAWPMRLVPSVTYRAIGVGGTVRLRTCVYEQ